MILSNALHKFTIVSSLILMAALVSCASFPKNERKEPPSTPTVAKEKDKVNEIAKTIGETSSDIGKRADTIDNHASEIESKTPDANKEVVKTEIKGIKEQTQGLRQDQTTLMATQQRLKDTEEQLAEQQKIIEDYTAFSKNSQTEISKLQEKVKELQSSNDKLLKTMMAWISVCCVIGIGASLVIGFFFKTPSAFIIAGGCVITLGISVAVSLYLQYIAWVALSVLGVGFVGVVIYMAVQIKARNKAVDELVHTGEVVKTYLPSTAREKIFGNKVEPGVAHIIQSSSTIDMVKKIRNKAKASNNIGIAPSIN
jgi:hypothetical protein